MKVVWLPRALRRLEQAKQYIARDKPEAAIQTVDRILECADRLGHFPDMGRTGLIAGTRQMYIYGTPFSLHYRVRAGRIEILTLLHGARQWPENL